MNKNLSITEQSVTGTPGMDDVNLLEAAMELSAPLPYVKFLAEPSTSVLSCVFGPVIKKPMY